MSIITKLATNTSLNVVENNIVTVSNLVNKTEYKTKINEIEKKITDHNHNNILLLQHLIS